MTQLDGFALHGYDQVVQVGEGGLGRVYRARRISTGGTVAIKELRDVTEASPAWHRAMREVEAMLRLKGHPNVVSVEEVVPGPNGPCIVMEYLGAGSLHDRLGQTHLSVPEVVFVGHEVATALLAAHTLGVIHRDVKPHNLLVSGFGHVKVADFGIAALMRDSGVRTQTQSLTLAYASPEELDGAADVGPPTDVYSLAATLAHLATGIKPSFRDRALTSWRGDEVAGVRKADRFRRTTVPKLFTLSVAMPTRNSMSREARSSPPLSTRWVSTSMPSAPMREQAMAPSTLRTTSWRCSRKPMSCRSAS